MINIIKSFLAEPVLKGGVGEQIPDDSSVINKGFDDVLQEIKNSISTKDQTIKANREQDKEEDKDEIKEEIEFKKADNGDRGVNSNLPLMGFNQEDIQQNIQPLAKSHEDVEPLKVQDNNDISLSSSVIFDNQVEEGSENLIIGSSQVLDDQGKEDKVEMFQIIHTGNDIKSPPDNEVDQIFTELEEDTGEHLLNASTYSDYDQLEFDYIVDNEGNLPYDISMKQDLQIAENQGQQLDLDYLEVELDGQIEENTSDNKTVENTDYMTEKLNLENRKQVKNDLRVDLQADRKEELDSTLDHGIDEKTYDVAEEKTSIVEEEKASISGVKIKEPLDLTGAPPGKLLLSHEELENDTDVQFNGIDSIRNTNKDNCLDFTKVLNKEDIVGQAEIIEELANKAIMTFKENSSELEIRLKPEHLGHLTLKVALEDGILTGKIFTSNERVKDFLQDNLENLRATLKEEGLVFTSLDVDVGSQPNPNRFGHLPQIRPKRNNFNSAIQEPIIGEKSFITPNNPSSIGMDLNRIDYLA